ncbi:MAG: hypothetical protein ACRDWW_08870, partial [Acidimicrobiales bacterium]
MLRCAGCGDLVSEFAARCPECRHTTDDAEELPDPHPEPAPEPEPQQAAPARAPAPAAPAEREDPGHGPGRRRGVLFGAVAAAIVVAGVVAGVEAASGPAVRSTGASPPDAAGVAGSVVVVAADGTM